MGRTRLPRLIATAALLAASAAAPMAATAEALPDPDYAAIERAAQALDPGKSYVQSLPNRMRECAVTSAPYLAEGATANMVRGLWVHMHCLEAMISQMAAIYYQPHGFDEAGIAGGLQGRLDRLREDLILFYEDVYNEHKECVPSGCGTLAGAFEFRASYVLFLKDLVAEMAWVSEGSAVDERWRAAWEDAWAQSRPAEFRD